MANRENYDRMMQQEIAACGDGERLPRLLLHACCAPCSSACLERVVPFFDVTVFYYNPNITEEAEYRMRAEEERRLLAAMPLARPVSFLKGAYEPRRFLEAVRGLEREPEGGKRCETCFRLRLLEAVRAAEENGFDYVTTTLTVSPLKNADLLNRVGMEAVQGKRVKWLPSDFKKRDGYRRSIELSRTYGLYRQNYCGCVFSRREREEAETE